MTQLKLMTRKKKRKNKFIVILFLITFPAITFCQEVMTGLYTNPALKNTSYKTHHTSTSKGTTMLCLPFIDDFSYNNIFPNNSLWANKNVFINSSTAKNPITIGVATFDALNDTGALYSNANAYSFGADTLTSNPIRLDSVFGSSPASISIADSLYFSFFYQPQGNGNSPQTDDSLVLEFYSPITGIWNHVWSSKGMTMSAFNSQYNTWFKFVSIPITDSLNYFQQGFQFRFSNYASVTNNTLPSWAGNVDNWNIDYVVLNIGRNKNDSTYKDIAFITHAMESI
jgi:hypothetical protein